MLLAAATPSRPTTARHDRAAHDAARLPARHADRLARPLAVAAAGLVVAALGALVAGPVGDVRADIASTRRDLGAARGHIAALERDIAAMEADVERSRELLDAQARASRDLGPLVQRSLEPLEQLLRQLQGEVQTLSSTMPRVAGDVDHIAGVTAALAELVESQGTRVAQVLRQGEDLGAATAEARRAIEQVERTVAAVTARMPAEAVVEAPDAVVADDGAAPAAPPAPTP